MTPDFDNALDKLYEACLWASPDESTRRAFKRLRTAIAQPDWHGPDTAQCLRVLTGALYDGLAFGNWPTE